MPHEQGRGAGVLVIHEMWGVNDDIRRIARRFADSGYVAAAPDILTGGLKIICLMRAMQDMQRGTGRAVDQLDAVTRLLEQRPDVERVGVAGFCLGGGFALLLGCRQKVSVAAVYYGDPRPRDELARSCPLVGGYGADDRRLAGKAREMIDTLDEVGVEHDFRIYDGAGHSYMSDRAANPLFAFATRPLMHIGYRDDAAEDSWRRMLAFFERHLAVA